MERYDLFVSYSHMDGNLANELVKKLEARGLRCFIAEKSLAVGDLWEEEIRSAICSAKRVVLVLTPRSVKSIWVAVEAGAAWALGIPLIVALAYVEPKDLIDPIRKHQARSIETSGEIDAFVAEVMDINKASRESIAGQWTDVARGDNYFWVQRGKHVFGFYDYGAGEKVAGFCTGTFGADLLEYRWQFRNRDIRGQASLYLADNAQVLAGHWWNNHEPGDREELVLRRGPTPRPDWLSEAEIERFIAEAAGAS